MRKGKEKKVEDQREGEKERERGRERQRRRNNIHCAPNQKEKRETEVCLIKS